MKIFRNGIRDTKMERDYSGRFTSFKKKVYWFFKRVFLGMGVLITGMSLWVGGQMNTEAIPLIEYVQAESNLPPVLKRIFECESKTQQFGKSGQVLINGNTNGTVDIGVGQINTVWFAKATELGYDLTKEKDNIAMASWIYENKGTGPWSASSKCWNK